MKCLYFFLNHPSHCVISRLLHTTPFTPYSFISSLAFCFCVFLLGDGYNALGGGFPFSFLLPSTFVIFSPLSFFSFSFHSGKSWCHWVYFSCHVYPTLYKISSFLP
ncbi:hypothetical protein HOY80DRAFT_120435 [Tuber brumale]|nr:hypothetical protein HOY80DRAFT_120435 [Tuber brumale]